MVKKLKILFFAIGISLFVFLVYKIGIDTIYANLLSMGYKFPIIFLPFFLVFFLDTLGWQYSFNHWSKGIRLRILYPVRWAGEAVNILTPSAYVGGEPVKAYILKRYGVSFHDGMASVVVGKTVMTMAQVVFLVVGVIVSTRYITANNYLIRAVVVAIIISIPVFCFFFYWQSKGLFTSIVALLERFKIKINYLIKNKEKIESLDNTISDFYKQHKKRFYLSFLYHFLGWLAGTLEVYTILYLMGYKISFFEALIIESFVQLLKSCSFFIPGSIGVVEGGGILVFTALGLSVQVGLAYGIFRRLRELIWGGIGLVILMMYNAGKEKVGSGNPSTADLHL
ncbi:MAG: flippase-like domain-containing protein [Candidatus Anammoxibacter sp.]